tara:strand:+ start:66 stop:476 length:411 start_codon:yes stop_codon:yes gene_type:complete
MEKKTGKKIYLKDTHDKGMGVYAGENIKKGELIEQCYLITVDTKQSELGTLYDYVFNYPQNGKFKSLVLPLGYGCIYNHDDNHNAIWVDSKKDKHFNYIAVSDIKVGEEICTDYGETYWSQMVERKPYLKKKTNKL